MAEVKLCANPDCQKPIDPSRYARTMYCDKACKARAHYLSPGGPNPRRDLRRKAGRMTRDELARQIRYDAASKLLGKGHTDGVELLLLIVWPTDDALRASMEVADDLIAERAEEAAA